MKTKPDNYETSLMTTDWIEDLKRVLPAQSIRELFSVFLLLRWQDVKNEEKQLTGDFEGSGYVPLLPSWLQLQNWAESTNPAEIADNINALASHIEWNKAKGFDDSDFEFLKHLDNPLRHIQSIDASLLLSLARWVTSLQLNPLTARGILSDIFDQVLTETRTPHDGEYTSSENLSRLVAELSNPAPGESVYDPCFGVGNFLISAWNLTRLRQNEQKHSFTSLQISGNDVNHSTFLTGLTRMVFSGISSTKLMPGNSLDENNNTEELFDIVVAHPPVGIRTDWKTHNYSHYPFKSPDITGLFVQNALSKLKSNGRAVIVVPEGFLFRSGADRDLRKHLVNEGLVQAVVGLPGGLIIPGSSLRGYLLVLNSSGNFRHVQMVDASNMSVLKATRKPSQSFLADTAELTSFVLARHLREWGDFSSRTHPNETNLLTESNSASEYTGWQVSAAELADVDWDLTPRHRDKNELLNALKPIVKGFEDGYLAPLSTISSIYVARTYNSADITEEPHSPDAKGYIQIRDLAHGKISRISRWLKSDVVYNPRWTLQSGDILISRSGTVAKSAVVSDVTSGSLAGHGLYVIRPNKNSIDPDYLLAYINSRACQSWLSAHARGTAIQRINRDVFLKLPVPVFPLSIQKRTVARYHNSSTDILTFISALASYSDADPFSNLLLEIESYLPRFVPGTEATPPLEQFEPIVELIRKTQKQPSTSYTDERAARDIAPFLQAIYLLDDVGKIPRGPVLLNVLQESERALFLIADNQANNETPLRVTAERIRIWLKAVIADLSVPTELKLISSPASLPADSNYSFEIQIENPGVLPLRNVQFKTQPDWGSEQFAYISEKSACALQLHGDTPKVEGRFNIRLNWQAIGLSGLEYVGEIELAFEVSESNIVSRLTDQDLGSSPYVTGTPLGPESGHNVFFGREDILECISRQISTHGNVILLEGNRRAGKTSILKHLEGKDIIPGWLSVYFSLQGVSGASNAAGVPTVEVFRGMARYIALALNKYGFDLYLPDGSSLQHSNQTLGVRRLISQACRKGISEEDPFDDFSIYLNELQEILKPMKVGIVLLLDEFDKLQEGIDSGITSPQVPENIRYLIQNNPQFSAILTGSRRLKRLREEYWSALFGLGTNVQVTALDKPNAIKVVTEPVRGRLVFAPDAIDKILKLTAMHPYLLQCLCNKVFDFAIKTRSKNISATVVDDCAIKLAQDNEHFANLWDYAGLGPATGRCRRQLVLMLYTRSNRQDESISFGSLHEQLTQMGVTVFEEALEIDLDYLRELELIEYSGQIDGGEYKLAIPLMAVWIAQQKDMNVVLSHARTEAEEENV